MAAGNESNARKGTEDGFEDVDFSDLNLEDFSQDEIDNLVDDVNPDDFLDDEGGTLPESEAYIPQSSKPVAPVKAMPTHASNGDNGKPSANAESQPRHAGNGNRPRHAGRPPIPSAPVRPSGKNAPKRAPKGKTGQASAAPKRKPSGKPSARQSVPNKPSTGLPSQRKANGTGNPQAGTHHPDLSQARRVAAQEAANTQQARAQRGIPHAADNAGNAGNDTSGKGKPSGNGPSQYAQGMPMGGTVGNEGISNDIDGNAPQDAGNLDEAEKMADNLFNGQQTAFEAEKAAAREKIANGHGGGLNGMIDNASNAVNDRMTGIANGINDRMKANGNGNLFDPNGGMMNRLGNALWKHGGSDMASKGLNAVNKGLQGAMRNVQQMGQKISQHAKSLMQIATNPVTWYTAAALLVVLAVVAATLTYGNGGILCPNQGAGKGGSGDEIASWAEKIAADDSHGYSQVHRMGNPDYDCSSLVYYAVTEGAGIKLSINYPFATGGAIDDASGEGGILQAAGFTKHAWDGKDTSVLQRGDIVWSDHHTEIYSGDGKFTGAHIDENGGTTGPQGGDQKGDEISTTNNTPSGMSYFLRSPGKSTSDSGTSSSGSSADFHGENAKRIFEYLTKEMGFSGAGAAGALAVAMRESGFDPKAKNPGGGVAGIFQWSGYSPGPNGNRIVAEGSIKAGDDSTLTMENELKLLGFELNGAYHKAKTTVGNASDPTQAAKDWSVLFEGVALSDGQSKVSQIEQWANEACDAFDCKSISAQPDKLNEGGNGADGTNPSTTANASTQVQCMLTKNSTGSTGDFKQGAGDYSWMCNDERLKICQAGDSGPVPTPYGYQCVWYAWTRLYMIHGINESYLGNGGQIGETAKEHGWTNPDKPAPGDGLSYYGLLGSSDRPTGHVMVVEKVEDDPSGWKITLSEGNYNCASSGCWNGYNGGRTLTKKQLEDAGGVQNQNYWFFHNPKWDSKAS